MYYTNNNKNKIFEDFPILKSNVDCIIHFISIDAVPSCDYDRALYALHKDAYEKIYDLSFESKIQIGQVLPYRKSNPVIIHVPIKNRYDDEFNIEYFEAGIGKLAYVFNNVSGFESMKKLGIQNNGDELNLYKEILNKKNLPEIIIF